MIFPSSSFPLPTLPTSYLPVRLLYLLLVLVLYARACVCVCVCCLPVWLAGGYGPSTTFGCFTEVHFLAWGFGVSLARERFFFLCQPCLLVLS